MSDSQTKKGSLRVMALKGLKWSSIQTLIIQALNYTSIIALAYWVDPEIHGFFAIAAMAAGLAGVAGGFGIGEIIIKDTDDDFRHKVPVYWTLVLIISGASYTISCLISLVVACFYMAEFPFWKMLKISLILSAIAPLGPIRAIMEALHSRRCDFKRISLVNLTSFATGIIPVFLLGYFDYGDMALGAKFLLPHLSYIIIGIFAYDLQFNLKWDTKIFDNIKGFVKLYSINNVVQYFLRNIDYIIIAKFFSPATLGQYVIAYKILLLPMKNITTTLNRIGMPLLAKLDYSEKRFKKSYFNIVETIAIVSFPIMIFLAFNSKEFVELTFNNKYDKLSRLVSFLAIAGSIQSVVSPVGMLFYFKEEMILMSKVSLLLFLVLSATLLMSSYTGNIIVVAFSYLAVYSFLLMPISLVFIYRKYGFSILDNLKAFGPYLIASLGAVMLPEFLLPFILEDFAIWLQLTVSLTLFSIVYMAMLIFLDKSRFGPRFYHEYFVRFKLRR